MPGGIWTTGALTIDTGSLIEGNNATGIAGGIQAGFKLNISDSTITDNHANGGLGRGGGIYLSPSVAGSSIVDSEITGNTADATAGDGGGIYLTGTPELTLTGTAVSNNSAGRTGAGIYATDALLNMTGGSIDTNVVTYTGTQDGSGGGLSVLGGTIATLDGVSVSGNTATASNPSGDAAGGGINVGGTGSKLNFSNGVLRINHASSTAGGNAFGGGLYLVGNGAAALVNTTVSENDAPTDAGGGGGLYNAMGTLLVSFSTLSGNEAGNGVVDGSGEEWPQFPGRRPFSIRSSSRTRPTLA